MKHFRRPQFYVCWGYSTALAMAGVLGFSSAFASHWITIDTDSNHATVQIDSSSIASVGKYRKAWFTFKYPTNQNVPTGPTQGAYYTSAVSLYYGDCSAQTIEVVQTIYYTEDNQTAGSMVAHFSAAALQDVAPDTSGANMLTVMCTPKLPK